MSCKLLLRINGPLNKNFLRNDFSVRMHASHINTHTTSVNVGEFYRIFTFRLNFWALFDTQLMNFT